MINPNNENVRYRGGIDPDDIVQRIREYDYSFLDKQKMGFYLSYTSPDYEFHAVDIVGSFPLYYCISNGRPVVSERVDELLPYLADIKLDPLGYVSKGETTGGVRTPFTPFKGVKRIKPGYYLVYKDGKLSEYKYWSFLDLNESKFKGSFDEAAEELGYLVLQGIKRCLSFSPSCALHLSGGFDSGMVAAVVSQNSTQNRHTYAAHNPQDLNVTNVSERSYIEKYQSYYPQLISHNLNDHINSKGQLYPEAENWLFIKDNNYEKFVAADVSNKNINIVLTGLGGDEFASYMSSEYNSKFRVKNDLQAKLYKKWITDRKGFILKYLRSYFSNNQSPGDHVGFRKYYWKINNYKKWYAPDFYPEIKDHLEVKKIWMGSIPSTFEYRLVNFNRTNFSIRSEVWNFIGRRYNVDYLHPLLDKDILEFCSSLPLDILKKSQSRNLIKKAMSQHMPQELLTGLKRPVMMAPVEVVQNDMEEYFNTLINNIQELRNSYASTIYDFGFLLKEANEAKINIPRIPKHHQLTNFSSRFMLAKIEEIIRGAGYINRYFGNS